jgi:hypothetical protein
MLGWTKYSCIFDIGARKNDTALVPALQSMKIQSMGKFMQTKITIVTVKTISLLKSFHEKTKAFTPGLNSLYDTLY